MLLGFEACLQTVAEVAGEIDAVWDRYNTAVTSSLTARERAHLKARAHALEPVVHIGGAGVTDALVAEVDRALTAHELIKVKIGIDDRGERVAAGDDLCARTGATAVHRVGKVIILWRARPDDAG
jgi:RNA-binding protein